MAGLAHSHDIAKDILATGCEAMNLPFASQHRIAPASVVATRLHRALALSASAIVRHRL